MKLTLISHACVLLEAGRDSLLLDPWLVGSCYWRSWWHFPPARADLVDPATVSAIYFTHEHDDHLHYPSLRRFPASVRILVPRFPVDRVAAAIRERGYPNVEEIPHAGWARVGRLEVFSYQYGTDDSSVVITDGETTLLNLNDARVSGLALGQILRRHPRIDFLLRSHSPAQAYPFCYTADDAHDLALVPPAYYAESFRDTVQVVRPRWAIPFASNVCHLHPESREQNAHLVSPTAVVEACHGRVGGADVVPMTPGDSWTRGLGFSWGAGRPIGWEANAEAIAAVGRVQARTLARAFAEEQATAPIDFATFREYLATFVRAVPWILRRAYPARVAFDAADDGYFVVDIGRARVTHATALPADTHSIVRANPRLLRAAIVRSSLNLIGISKRIRVHVRRGGLVCDAAFWGLLTIYELGYLPLRAVLTARGLGVLASRWRELIGYVPVFLRPARSLHAVIASTALRDKRERA